MQCARAVDCTMPEEYGKPVLSCDQFERLLEPRREDRGTAAAPETGFSRMEGLCVDCENRESCVFRRREGGTWHCEEYC